MQNETGTNSSKQIQNDWKSSGTMAAGPKMSTRKITSLALLSAIAAILMFIETPLPFMPGFLKFDISEIPVLLGAFAFGPGSAIIIELIKNLIHLPFTQTAGVGELANFLAGSMFAGTAGLIYRFFRSRKGAIISMAAGTVMMTVFTSLFNYYFMLDFYVRFYGMPMEKIVAMSAAVNIFVHETENPALAGSIRAILEEKRTLKEYAGEVEKCLVQKLLLEIARVNPLEARKNDQPLKLKKAMIHSLAYVDEHYAETIKIETLAEVSHLSETHFRRVFENIMHMMPVDYINFIRIQKACEYLKNSNDSIENIAIKVGYVSLSTFHRNFRKFVGASPYKWKNAAENAKTKLFNYKITALKGW